MVEWFAVGRSLHDDTKLLFGAGLVDGVDYAIEFITTGGRQFLGEGRVSGEVRPDHYVIGVDGTGPLMGIDDPDDFFRTDWSVDNAPRPWER